MQIAVAGETLELHPDCAAYWAASRTLVIADVHLGKGAAFRRCGIPIPVGASRADLSRIDALIMQFAPQRLLVLGDLFHPALTPKDPAIAAFDEFRLRHPELAIQSFRGGQDRDMARLPTCWKIEWLDGPQLEGPFVFRHSPEADPRGYVLAGHIHPAFKVSQSCTPDAARMPIFWFQRHLGVLPAFCGLTGGYTIAPNPLDRIVAVTPSGLLSVNYVDSLIEELRARA